MSKKIKKLVKSAKNSAEPAANKLSARLFGKNSPSIGHTYDSVYRFYKSKKDSAPYLTVRANGSYRVPLFRLIATFLGVLAAMFMISLIIKKAVSKYREHRARKLFEAAAYRGRGADIPF